MVWNGANDPQEYLTDEKQEGLPDKDAGCGGWCRPLLALYETTCPVHGARALKEAMQSPSVKSTEENDK